MKILKLIFQNQFSAPIFIFAGHLILLYVMAGTNLVSSLFAAGDHIPKFKIFIAVIFLALRLFAILYLPGWAIFILFKKIISKTITVKFFDYIK
jgi:hypothetical protein